MTSIEIERLRGELAMAHNAVRIALIRMDAYRQERDDALAALRELQQRVDGRDDAAADPRTGVSSGMIGDTFIPIPPQA